MYLEKKLLRQQCDNGNKNNNNILGYIPQYMKTKNIISDKSSNINYRGVISIET